MRESQESKKREGRSIQTPTQKCSIDLPLEGPRRSPNLGCLRLAHSGSSQKVQNKYLSQAALRNGLITLRKGKKLFIV